MERRASAGVAERGGDPGDRAEQRPRRRLVAGRDSGAGARPGSRSSGRRTGSEAGPSAGGPDGARAARRAPTISSSAADRPLVLGDDRSEEAVARRPVRDELQVALGDLEARLRERHLEVVEERAEERPLPVEAPQLLEPSPAPRGARRPFRSRTRRAAAQRFCVQAKTHGMARSEREVALVVGPPRRPGAEREQRELVDRREGAEERRRTSSSSQTRARYASCAARRERVEELARPVGGSAPATAGNAERSVAASAASRFRYARPGSPYLKEIVSPCSVTFSRPGRTRRAAGPGSPRASGRRRGRRCRRGRGRSSARGRARAASAASSSWARKISHCARQVAAVLARVGVADHHLEPAPAASTRRAKRGSSSSAPTMSRRRAQVVDRLEERHEREREVALLGQVEHREDVGRRARRRRRSRVSSASGAVPLACRARSQRTSRARRSDGSRTSRGVQAHVELREVEAEQLDPPPERRRACRPRPGRPGSPAGSRSMTSRSAASSPGEP